MIVWCQRCEIEPVDFHEQAQENFHSEFKRPLCIRCCHPKRYVIGYQDLDGALFTDEVSEEEYWRIMSGQGSAWDIAWSLEGMAAAMDRIRGDR